MNNALSTLIKESLSGQSSTPARTYSKGMGEAVAARTINRKIRRKLATPEMLVVTLPRNDDLSLDHQIDEYCISSGIIVSGRTVLSVGKINVKVSLTIVEKDDTEKWEDVAFRVAEGNTSLRVDDQALEFTKMHHHLRQASILMSGRHLQHGDSTQKTRPGEVFTNCSTSAVSFLTFYLLLNGSGVGRCYDNAMQMVDFANLPIVVCALDSGHKDSLSGEITAIDKRNAEHLYANKTIHYFEVPDSREGWAKAIEKLEIMAFQGTYRDDVLILEFSSVRPRNSPIAGMQDRPASGPGPLMAAIAKVATLREAKMDPWRGNMYADHYLAECVLVGGARRAARMATKTWRDENVFDFVSVKRGGFLWSSNNSVTVDMKFWDAVKKCKKLVNGIKQHSPISLANLGGLSENGSVTSLEMHAWKVFLACCEAAYYDGTGEPGFITVEKLTWSEEGTEVFADGNFAESSRYKLEKETLELTKALATAWGRSLYKVICNPCGEIVLSILGGYCTIADVVPYHAQNDDDAEDAFKVATRALIRTNLMEFLYDKEVKRTNRIGVGITGFHEWVWARFGFGWKDIVNEEVSKPMWLMLSRFKRAIQNEARRYSLELGVSVPHTDTTAKPAGTTSKLFGLTEGWHLASMREFLRWVQFRNDDPLVENYRLLGYPIKKLTSYAGTTIVGFPTQPEICKLGMGDKLVTAAEATPEEQYEYLRLSEKYWLTGVEEDGVTPLRESGNQISYTLKYDPTKVSFEKFMDTLLNGQSQVRCCSVMPQSDTTAYEYQPEEPTTKAQYERIVNAIKADMKSEIKEDVGQEHVDCPGGACPISFNGS
jgi:hypothetical protein